MKLPFKTKTPSKPAPAGAHPARLVRIVDRGTHQTDFVHDDGTPVTKRVLDIGFELYTDPKMDDGRPFMVSSRFTRSLHEKSGLYKMLSAWLGAEFDSALESGSFELKDLLGRTCMVAVNHGTSKTGNPFAKVGAVTQLPKMLEKSIEPQVNPSLLFDLDEFDKSVYDQLPEWQREEIAKSPEYLDATRKPIDSEDIPF